MSAGSRRSLTSKLQLSQVSLRSNWPRSSARNCDYRATRDSMISSMSSVQILWWTTMSSAFTSNDTGYVVFNNPGFQTYSTVGDDRAVLSGIMPIVTSAVHILRMLGLCELCEVSSQTKSWRQMDCLADLSGFMKRWHTRQKLQMRKQCFSLLLLL